MEPVAAVSKAIAYLETHLQEPVDEAALARISQLTYPMFCRMFSLLTGYALGDYIRRRRLTLAMAALQETDRTILDIALNGDMSPPTGSPLHSRTSMAAPPPPFAKGIRGRYSPP